MSIEQRCYDINNSPCSLNSIIEALLVDEELADAVWELSDAGIIPDDLAAIAWWLVSNV